MPSLAQIAPNASQQATGSTSPSAGTTKIEPAKEADIRRLLELTGVKALAAQMMDDMMENVRPILSNSLPPGEYQNKLIDLFVAKFRDKADPQHLIEMAIPIYDKNFSAEEIKGLIQFYQTPLGQKMIRALPMVTGELQREGKRWGEGLGRDSMREVLAEHPDLAQALEAAAKSSR
jgi:hypothetical protein